MKPRLAIITTHPIQYNAPLFKELAKTGLIEIKVYYTWGESSMKKFDPGFGQNILWDIPLLQGYDYNFVKNTSKKPGSNHFFGVRNPSLIEEIKIFTPNAILIYGWNFHSHLKVMRHFKGRIPIWFRGDSTLIDYDYRSFKDLIKALKQNNSSQFTKVVKQYLRFLLRRLFLTWVYRHIDKAFYVGTNNRIYYLAHGLKESQLIWMPHTINNQFFQGEEENKTQEANKWRNEMGIKDDDLVILFAGKFEPKKNPELLIKGIIEINKKHKSNAPEKVNEDTINYPNKPIHLIMVGSGILESKLLEISKSEDFIHFLPFQNQSKMPVVYRLGNVFCLPSKGPNETWGLAVNESMACGLPVIVSNKVGCAVDLIKVGQNGFIFTSNDSSDLMNKIESLLLKDPEKTGELSKNIISKWSIQEAVNSIIKYLV